MQCKWAELNGNLSSKGIKIEIFRTTHACRFPYADMACLVWYTQAEMFGSFCQNGAAFNYGCIKNQSHNLKSWTTSIPASWSTVWNLWTSGIFLFLLLSERILAKEIERETMDGWIQWGFILRGVTEFKTHLGSVARGPDNLVSAHDPIFLLFLFSLEMTGIEMSLISLIL